MFLSDFCVIIDISTTQMEYIMQSKPTKVTQQEFDKIVMQEQAAHLKDGVYIHIDDIIDCLQYDGYSGVFEIIVG